MGKTEYSGKAWSVDVLAVRDYKADTRKDLKTGEVTATGLPSSMSCIMSYPIMHGAVYVHPEQNRRLNFMSVLREIPWMVQIRCWKN